jgi:heat shock protein HslJ
MESEAPYLEALWRVRSISLSENGNLALSGDDVELLFESVPPPPTKRLVGPTWQLQSMIEGRGSDATATNAEPAELKMSRDGTFTGSTGCRRLTGEWSEDGDSILFHTMAADGNCPEDLRTQDSYVVGVLGDGFTATIDGDRLRVYNVRGNLGLIYRAE